MSNIMLNVFINNNTYAVGFSNLKKGDIFTYENKSANPLSAKGYSFIAMSDIHYDAERIAGIDTQPAKLIHYTYKNIIGLSFDAPMTLALAERVKSILLENKRIRHVALPHLKENISYLKITFAE